MIGTKQNLALLRSKKENQTLNSTRLGKIQKVSLKTEYRQSWNELKNLVSNICGEVEV